MNKQRADAIAYTRLSQASDTSIDRQKRHIREYAEENGFLLLQMYDDGEQASGFDTEEREEYQQLRQHVTGEADYALPDAVIVNDKRRLARDVDEVMRLIPDLRQYEVELHTYQDGALDLSDPMRASIEILQAAAAHEEKLEEIRKSIEATEERLEKGYDHGEPPTGLTFDDDGRYWVPADGFYRCLRAIAYKDQGVSLRGIEDRTGIPYTTVGRIVDRRDKYEKHVTN